MAQGILKDTQMRLIFETGLDGEGKPILKGKTFNSILKEATVDQIYQAAQAISELCAYTLVSVERNDSFDVLA
jgi:hypothetical protein